MNFDSKMFNPQVELDAPCFCISWHPVCNVIRRSTSAQPAGSRELNMSMWGEGNAWFNGERQHPCIIHSSIVLSSPALSVFAVWGGRCDVFHTPFHFMR